MGPFLGHFAEWTGTMSFTYNMSGIRCAGCKKDYDGHNRTSYKAKWKCKNCGLVWNGKSGIDSTYCSVACSKKLYPMVKSHNKNWADCTNTKCTYCNGTGKQTSTCSHGYTSSHRYCSHYSNTSLYSHEY